jgi:DNA polymerase II large subunit
LSPTVYEGAVTKYLGLSKGLATQDGVGDYLKQRVQILEASILTLFPQPQTSLQTFSDEDPEEKL